MFVLAVAAVLTTSFAPAQPQALPSILVARQLASLEGLRVGDEVQLSRLENGADPRRFRIAGIYEPTPDPMRLGSVPRDVRLHLPDLLAFVGTPTGAEHVDTINVALIDPATASAFARDVNSRVPGVYARPAEGAGALGDMFVVLEHFHWAIAAVTIVAATVFLLALTIMLVDERRETAGVLRLIGMPVRRILGQVLIEGVLIAGVGALFGLLLALASESLINRFFQWRYDTALVFVRVTPRVAAFCLAVAVPLGAVATVAASWALLRRNALRLVRR
ncbi:MAG: ABC transporter permease [Acidobacteria bacterium]|nr:ABC transporter permease [Acidobacteriota bacterium]